MTVRPDAQKLRYIVTLAKGKPPLRQPYLGRDSELYLTPEYLRGGVASEPIKVGSNAVRVSDGDTIVLWDGSNAGEVFKGRDGVLSSTMTWLKQSDSFDPAYFYYAVKQLESFLKAQTSGSGIPHVDKEVFGNLEVLRFAEPEQIVISAVLSSIDLAIGLTEATISKQRRIRTGLMQDLLTGGIDKDGKLRSESTHAFKDSSIGRIPVDWCICELGTIAEVVTSGPRGWARYYSDDGPLFLRIGNLTRDNINLRLDDVVRVSPPVASEGSRTSLRSGDLLISITADLGIIGVVPDHFDEAYINQHIALVRLASRDNARFIGWFLSGHGGQAQFEKLNESGAKAGLNLPTVRRIELPRPQLSEQLRIAEMLDSTTRQQDADLQQLNKLLHLKSGLMQDLLTGARRVTALL